jgi:predicted alternative tryptophan synthase beta-subunit
MIADRHYWRTADGRLVETGHSDAEVLAYTAGDEIPDDVARKNGLVPAPEAKHAPAPANKARGKTADK